ncbi:MAG: hypothetical protein GXP15_08025 [Gammaproteobacteria bacterium]|nr:hypothetical protein [Gammaproteobacteria bacterium]
MNVQVPELASLNSNAPPKLFWVISAASLLWNLAGSAAFLAQITLDTSALPNAERAFYESVPAWATIAFGVAVFAGVLGSVGLLLRRHWAIMMFIVSLLGIVVQNSHAIFIGDGFEVFGAAGFVLPFFILIAALALIGYARRAARRAWIG